MSRRLVLTSILGSVILAGCGERATVLAKVDDRSVQVEVFQTYLSAVASEPWQSVDERVASRLLDQFLDQEVVAATARRERDVRVPLEPGERSAMIRRLLAEVCDEAVSPAAEEVEREVERRMAEPARARARVRQMLLDDPEVAAEVRRRLDAGEEWVALSRAVSRAANADGGGELGYLVQGTLPEELDEVIFALAEGEISTPVASSAGYHIFQVLDVVAAGTADRAEVEAEVRRELAHRHERQAVQECIRRLAAEAEVTVYEEHLWFGYHGRYAEDANDDGKS